MKKITLLATSIPALLLAASCGASNSQSKRMSLIESSNPGDVKDTFINAFCKDCLVKDKNSSKAPSNILMTKRAVGSGVGLEISPVSSDIAIPEEIGFTYIDINGESQEGQRDSDYVYTKNADNTAELTFMLPSEDLAWQKVNIVIDASVSCMDFAVNISDSAKRTVTFDYNGALDHVDWGDGTDEDAKKTTHTYSEGVNNYAVKVYGDLTSVWFTDRTAPTSKSKPLTTGNTVISELYINNSIKNIPDYAFNGCEGLEKTYIGSSVKTVGKKAFKLNNLEEDLNLAHNVIYTSYNKEEIQKLGWDEEWTDCPICYSIAPSEMSAEDHYDSVSKHYFKVIYGKQNYAMITGTTDEATSSGMLNIPSQVDFEKKKIPVVSIAPFAFYGDKVANIKSIAIASDQFSEIGEYAFANCTAAITSIDVSAIKNPYFSYFKIGKRAFWHCSGGSGVQLKFGETKIKNAELIIEDEAFSGSVAMLKSIKFATTNSFTLKTIHKRAFFGCSSFLGILDSKDNPIIPESVTTIEDEAFSDCYALKSDFIIPATVTSIGKNVFINCYGFGGHAIRVAPESKPTGWDEDWNVYWAGSDPADKTWIDVTWGFVKTFTDSGTDLIYNVVSKNGQRQAILIGSTKDKASLTSLVITKVVEDENGVEYPIVAIGDYAFQSCYELKTVKFDEESNVTEIGDYAFAGCSALPGITLPANVKDVGDQAFTSVPVVFYKGTAEDAAKWNENWDGALNGNAPTALYTDNYVNQISATDLTDDTFDIVSQVPVSNDEFNASIYKYNAPATNEGEVIIPAQVEGKAGTHSEGNTYKITSIGGRSFTYATLTNGIDFSKATNLTSIDRAAFYASTLSSDGKYELQLPATVSNVGGYAFAESKGVETFDLSQATAISSIPIKTFSRSDATTINLPTPKNNEKIEFGTGAFAEMPNLTTIDLSKTNATKIPDELFFECAKFNGIAKLPTTIQSIGRQAFSSTGITGKVDLSSFTSLTTIAENGLASNKDVTEIILPSSFETFGRQALMNNEGLLTLDLTQINDVVHASDNLLGKMPEFEQDEGKGQIKVPASLLERYQADDTWKSYKAHFVPVK